MSNYFPPVDPATAAMLDEAWERRTAKRAELHRITMHASVVPNLDDIFRLIRYLREHSVWHSVSGSQPLGVEWLTNGDGYASPSIREGNARGIAFVGPDGTAYDNERNPL